MILVLLPVVAPAAAFAAEPSAVARLAEHLRELPANVLAEDQRRALVDEIRDDLDNRLQAANDRSSRQWRTIQSRTDWERFRDERLGRLRESLGQFPAPPEKLDVRVTGTLDGKGYAVENLVYESRPGLWVTANLYRPARLRRSMAGILISHSHHTPKEHGELQDMGMTWARAGCVVLVPDHLGHGERRQHPFVTADDYHEPYRVSRQDYYFRYDTGIQLHLVGESLIGWIVWDLMRGVDVLLAREGVDPARIILLGAVAGGGDAAAVAGALDRRIAAVVPFNFGGPQPETTYPLPDDAEDSFDYAGRGSWESTRNLRRSAADGFLPWVIVGAIAPRRLIYAHEFSWDRPRDPVWKRLERIYGLYDARDHLAFAHGGGVLQGRPPEATHCTHIGQVHRAMIHPVFRRRFELALTEEDEYQDRRDPSELRCMTPEQERKLRPRRLCELVAELAAGRAAGLHQKLAGKPPEARRADLRTRWARLLGDVRPRGEPRDLIGTPPERPGTGEQVGRIWIKRTILTSQSEPPIPVLLLLPLRVEEERVRLAAPEAGLPVVVPLAQAGKEAFLRHRADQIAALVAGGAAVCLPDVRGTGETRISASRGRSSAATARSSTTLMLGDTMVGARLRDLLVVLRCLRASSHVDGKRIALWGDSFAPVNPPETDSYGARAGSREPVAGAPTPRSTTERASVQEVPRGVDGRPAQSEPLGGLLALLGALFEDDVRAVYVRGAVSDFHSVLESPFVQIPHDAVIPGVILAGDLGELSAALAPRPLRLDALVDGLNRRRSDQAARRIYAPAAAAYRKCGAPERLGLHPLDPPAPRWLLDQLKP
jgi:cephalosporin-C deacetylase-like acetyl esterase